MKHVLITGGAGFIGSHLCEEFLERGYAVTAIDNFVTGRTGNLDNALKNPRFELVEADISRPIPEARMQLLRTHGLQGVLHFACPASPVDFDRIPFEILEVDSIGTLQTLDWASRYNARYILASTSEIYGDPLVHPQTEDYFGNVNPIGPRSCYDETKRFAEACVSTAMTGKGLLRGHSYKPLDAAIVRIFNTYGPRMRPNDGRVVPEVCMSALQGADLPVYGDGLQTRSLCFVSDLVEGIVRLFESDFKGPMNLGNPNELSVLEIAKIVTKLARSSSRVDHLPARPDDPRKRRPHIQRAKEILNWQPRIGIEEGLTRTLEHFKNDLAMGLRTERVNVSELPSQSGAV
jgi:dTDP-glucose 4,6-dehydratase